MGIKQRPRGIFTLPLAAGLTMALAACQGGAVFFEGGASGQVNVNENTTAPVWKAIAKVTGTSSTAGITYRLRGPDAEQFSVNTNGEISFRQAADFEHPLDADKNNEYQIEIEASANTQPAVQSLRITLEDVKKPKVALLQPKPYENVGKGDEVEVATRVRVFDAESNTPLNGLAVKQNSMTLQQDATDPSLWKGTILVPEGGVAFALSAILADGTELTSSAKLLNKRNSVSPEFLGVNPGVYLIFFDPETHTIGKLVLSNMLWSSYFTNQALNNLLNLEFSSGSQTLYSSHGQLGTQYLFAMKVGTSTPEFLYHLGCWPNQIANIVYDTSNKRALIVTTRQEQGSERFQIVSVASDQNTGFVDAQANLAPRHAFPRLKP